MLDFKTVYDNASKRERIVLDKISGNTLDDLNMVLQLSSNKFTRLDIDRLDDIVELYKSLDQNEGFIKVLDKALSKSKRASLIIDKVLKESKIFSVESK
jgi:hypothetical protein